MTDEIRYLNTLKITKKVIQDNISWLVQDMRKHDKKLYKAICGEVESLMLQALSKIDSIRYVIEARDC